MTVSSQLNRVPYNGTGALTPLAVSFPFHSKADLFVIETVILTGVQTLLTHITHYTISGTTDALGYYSNGGTVTPVISFATTVRWTIYRAPALLQQLNLTANDSMPAESLEAQFDYLTMLVQRVSDLIGRSLRQPDGDSANMAVLPSKVERASKYLAWNAGGDPVATAGTALSEIITTAFTEAILGEQDGDEVMAIIIQDMTAGGALDALDMVPLLDESSNVGHVTTLGAITTLVLASAPAASTALAGKIELATQAEADAGTPVRALTTDLNGISRLTEVLTTSGTAFDFTIPTGVRRVQVVLIGVSLSGTDNLLIQLGDAGGVETTGYVSTGAAIAAAGVTVASSTAGFMIKSGVAANLITGIVTIVQERPVADTPMYVASYSLKSSTTVLAVGGGDKIMSVGELTTVRITRDGTDTFDTGLINVTYER